MRTLRVSVLGQMLSKVRRAHPATWVVVAASVTYSLLLTALTILKFESFHATFGDLGLENHILWLLAHGGLTSYDQSGFATVYAFNFQKPIVLVFLPFYALVPQITFLLAVQSFILGSAAIPLYMFARERLRRPWTSALVGASYLFYFPVASANLFDFHYEAFMPLFFFLMLFSWAKGWRRGMYAAALLCASINPLPLITVILFLLYLPLEGWLTPDSLRRAIRDYFRRFIDDPVRVGIVALLLAALVIYKAIGSLPLAGVGSSGAGLSPVEIVLFDVNAKLFLFLLLFGALAFLPLFDRMTLVLLLPYVGFAFYSANSADWQPFGLAYTALAAGPLYLGVTRVLGQRLGERTGSESHVAKRTEPAVGVAKRPPRWRVDTSDPRLVFASVVLVFAIVYFPVSPVNAYVSGGYFAGNHGFSEITDVPPAAQFLNRVISLIPPNAAVLTQNDIPQVSGREYYQVDQYYTGATPYDYILMDSAENYFTTQSAILTFVQPALANGSFGIIAEGQGALLLGRGYTGSPELFEPTNQTYNAYMLTAFSSSTVENGRIVGSAHAYSVWYGPFATLYPGNYTTTFFLSSSRTGNSSAQLVTIDVTATQGSVTLATEPLYASNFTAVNTTQAFVLHFHLANVTTGIELRGMYPTGEATISLTAVTLNQTL